MKYIANPVVVEAHVIEAVDGPHPLHGGQLLRTALGQMLASDEMLARYLPVPGDYFVTQSDGYTYVNPKDVFERKYSRISLPGGAFLKFGEAISALKNGYRVCREGWNGKGMWLSYSPGSQDLPAEKFWSPHNRAFAESNGGKADVLPCITMKTADGKILMGWLASQTDMLAEDWMIVE